MLNHELNISFMIIKSKHVLGVLTTISNLFSYFVLEIFLGKQCKSCIYMNNEASAMDDNNVLKLSPKMPCHYVKMPI